MKFLPEKKVSNDGSIEITDKQKSDNELIRNILSINGVEGIFLSEDFLSVNKKETKDWEQLKHIIISFINKRKLGLIVQTNLLSLKAEQIATRGLSIN